MKRIRVCSKCRAPGHYATTCQRSPNDLVSYSAESNRIFINALREWLGLKPICGGA